MPQNHMLPDSNDATRPEDTAQLAKPRSLEAAPATELTCAQPPQPPMPPERLDMGLADAICENRIAKLACIALLVVLGLVSFFGLRPHMENPDTWTGTIEVIDAKKGNVLALTTSSIALSAGISAIPGDTGTPIAEQLSQLASNLGIVLSVLYLEKYLLTTLGFLSFGILFPLACALFAISLGMHGRYTTGHTFYLVGVRLLIVGVIAATVIPASVWVTQRIDETYQISSTQAQTEANAKAAADSAKSDSSSSDDESDKNLLDQLIDGVSELTETVSSGLQSVTDTVVQQVTNIIEGAIVMIVTSCVIPILVLVVFLWMGHVLLGIDISRPTSYLARRFRHPLGTGAGKGGSFGGSGKSGSSSTRRRIASASKE